MPTIQELQERLAAAQTHSDALKQAVEAEMDLDALTDLQARYAASQTIVGRLKSQLDRQLKAQAEMERISAERERIETLDSELARLKNEHGAANLQCSEILNDLAEAISDTIFKLEEAGANLGPHAGEHFRLFKQRYGRDPGHGEVLTGHWRVPHSLQNGSEYQDAAARAVLVVSEMIVEDIPYDLALQHANGSPWYKPTSVQAQERNVDKARKKHTSQTRTPTNRNEIKARARAAVVSRERSDD